MAASASCLNVLLLGSSPFKGKEKVYRRYSNKDNKYNLQLQLYVHLLVIY